MLGIFFLLQVLFFQTLIIKSQGQKKEKKKKSDISESWSHLMCQIPDSS